MPSVCSVEDVNVAVILSLGYLLQDHLLPSLNGADCYLAKNIENSISLCDFLRSILKHFERREYIVDI